MVLSVCQRSGWWTTKGQECPRLLSSTESQNPGRSEPPFSETLPKDAVVTDGCYPGPVGQAPPSQSASPLLSMPQRDSNDRTQPPTPSRSRQTCRSVVSLSFYEVFTQGGKSRKKRTWLFS